MFNYQISTPKNQLFKEVERYSQSISQSTGSSSSNSSTSPRRNRGLSVLERDGNPNSSSSSLLSPTGEAEEAEAEAGAGAEVDHPTSRNEGLPKPESGYPILLFLGAEMLTTAHMFSGELRR